MQSKTLYLLLALSVMVALVTALEEDDDLFEAMFENYMEKRKGGRRGKGKGKNKPGPCPGRSNCWCAFGSDGEYTVLTCMPTGNGGQVGI